MGDLSLTQILISGVVLLGASMLQATVGFGAGLFGIPLLMLAAGASLPEAVMLNLVASFIQNLGGVVSLRKDFELREAISPMSIRLCAIPLGVLVLWLSDAWLSPQLVKMVLGVVLLVLLGLQWYAAPSHATPLHEIWKWIAFGSSGFLVGFCGMGGPPMVLWVMAQPWNAFKSRAFLFCMFLSSLIPHILLLYLTFGSRVNQAMLLGVIGLPWIIAGTWAGLKVGAMLPKSRLRLLAYSILVITAVAAIISPFMPEREAQTQQTEPGDTVLLDGARHASHARVSPIS